MKAYRTEIFLKSLTKASSVPLCEQKLEGWNPGSLIVDGKTPIDFNGDRISSKMHRVFPSENVSTPAY